MRRLPIYILIDCSESMAGQAIEDVRTGLESLIKELRRNPHTLETVYLSVITFHYKAKMALPLTDVMSLSVPKLTLGSGTALGDALKIFEQSLATDVRKTSAESKGDWKSLCFIFTDGEPTDAWEPVADRIRRNILDKKALIVAVACGPDVNVNKLTRITNCIHVFKNENSETFSKYFQWVTAMISDSCKADKVLGGPTDIMTVDSKYFDAISDEIMYKNVQRENKYQFLHLRCSKTQSFYLIRLECRQIVSDGVAYRGVATHKIDDFDFDEGFNARLTRLSTSNLLELPPCPYCGAYGFGKCECGKLHCIQVENEEMKNIECICPWCEKKATYSVGGGGFDISKGGG